MVFVDEEKIADESPKPCSTHTLVIEKSESNSGGLISLVGHLEKWNAENAGTEYVGQENVGPCVTIKNCRGGKSGTGKCRTRQSKDKLQKMAVFAPCVTSCVTCVALIFTQATCICCV